MSAIKNFFLFIILSFLFFMSGFIIPFTGIFFLPLSSVSLVILFIKNGVLSGLFGIITSIAVIYKFIPIGDILSFVFILFVILNSIFLYSGIKRKKSCWRIIIVSSIAVSFVSIAIILFCIINGFQISWIFGKIAAGLPRDISTVFLDVTTRNIYSIVVIFIIIMTSLSYILLSLVSDRFNVEIKKIQHFEKWRLSEKFIFAFIVSLLFYMVFKHKSAIGRQISENIINVIFFLYFIGGLSIGKFFFSKSKVMLILLYIVFFLYSPLAVLLGLSDVWLDFRKKRGTVNNEGNLKTGY